MRLSELMSAAGLALYPTIALILFLSAFAVIAVRVVVAKKRDIDHAANLPLADDAGPARHSHDGAR